MSKDGNRKEELKSKLSKVDKPVAEVEIKDEHISAIEKNLFALIKVQRLLNAKPTEDERHTLLRKQTELQNKI
jgi:phosphoenolpyruvate carboxylase